MFTFLRTCHFASIFTIIVTSGCSKQKSAPSQNTQSPSLTFWKPDSSLEQMLDGPDQVGAYSIRPPKGYIKIEAPNAPPGTKMIGWSGAPRSDGTSSMIQIMITKPPAGVGIPEMDDLLTKMLEGVKKLRTDWSQTTFERGTINGLSAIRTKWSGTNTAKGWKMHGIMYVAIDGETFVTLQTQDVEPNHEQPLKVGEAALLTFKKK